MKKLIILADRHIIFLSLLILAGAVRSFFISLPAFKIDMDAWVAWAYRLAELGVHQFYSTQVWTNYTPGYLYILYILGIFNSLLALNQQTVILFIKLISIAFELGLAFMLYAKFKEISQKQKLILICFLLFNPSLIFNSTVWGQIDGILSFFLILAVYYLQNSRHQKSSLSYAYAFLIKPQSIAIAPLYLIELMKNRSLKKAKQIIIPGVWLFFILAIPFFLGDPIFGIFKLIFQMSQDYPATSLFAYNLWGIVGFWVDDLKTFGPFSYRMIGTLLYLGAIIAVIYLGLKRKANYFLLAALLCLSFYFLPTRVHERYLYPAIPFLFISAFLFKSKVLTILSSILSLFYFLSEYYVYIYYNEMYLHLNQALMYEPLYNLLDQNGKLMSLLSTTVFIMIVFVIIKIIYAQKTERNT